MKPLISPLNKSVLNVSSASLAILGIIIKAKEGIIAIFELICKFSKERVKSEGLTKAKNKENPNPPMRNREITRKT